MTSRDTAVAFSKRLIARLLNGGPWQVKGQTFRCADKALETATSFAFSTRIFPNNDDSSLKVEVGSTGVFRNKYGNLLIGEVSRIDALNGTFTIVEYTLLDSSQNSITRFKEHQHADAYRSLYYTCLKVAGGNLVLQKLPTTCKIHKDEGQFVEMLDLSRKFTDGFYLINSSKFSTFWWALSHETNNISN